MQIRDVRIKNKVVQGVEIPLPHSPLVMVIAPGGYLMCGYLKMETAEKLGDCAAIVKGVKNTDEILAGKVVEVSSEARKAGIKAGMTGIRALAKML